eukprot:6439821-Lingulodinium_polyedra.AAC.1
MGAPQRGEYYIEEVVLATIFLAVLAGFLALTFFTIGFCLGSRLGRASASHATETGPRAGRPRQGRGGGAT